MKKIPVDSFRVSGKGKVTLKDWPTETKLYYDSDETYLAHLQAAQDVLFKRQDLLYAMGEYSVLLTFQGMDTAGKDGAVAHVMKGFNPQGCTATSFKTPTYEELGQDYLWRAVKALPPRGKVGIFNRSYYEDVLMPRVHPEILEKSRLPAELRRHPHRLVKERLHDIVHFEDYLARNGTRMVKFFLHLSKQEQKKRLEARIDDKEKHWKVTPADFDEREFWSDYQRAYEHCLESTSTKTCPWYIVPADDKKNARLIISHILVEHFKALPLHYPKPSAEQKAFIRKMKEEEKA